MSESISRTLLESVGEPPVGFGDVFLWFCFAGVEGGGKVTLKVSSNSERWFITKFVSSFPCVCHFSPAVGKLGIYDADGDGDFDVGDAKVLLGEHIAFLLSLRRLRDWSQKNIFNIP